MLHRRPLWTLGALTAGCMMATAYAAPPVTAKPDIFAPGEISTAVGVDCLAFMPDGNTVFFHQEPWGAGGMIMVSHRRDGHWSIPRIASFSGRWHDHDPAVSPDGSYIVFASNHPDEGGDEPLHGGHLWRVNRQGDGWSKPVLLPDEVNFGTYIYAPSIAANGDLYFQSLDNPSHQFHIYRSAWRNGGYQKAERLKLGPSGGHELDPAIAPDGSFIVFDANYDDKSKPDHLYIAFRQDDHWSEPIDLGDTVDSYQPWCPHLGPNGTTLYFSSSYTRKADYPRTPAQAREDLERIRTWNNGTTHIWRVSLTPWLDAYHAATKH